MKEFDLMSVVDKLDEKFYEEGQNELEFVMNDSSTVEVFLIIEYVGRMVWDPYMLNDPYFAGCCDATILDVKAYESDGTRMIVLNEKQFKNKLVEYLNRE